MALRLTIKKTGIKKTGIAAVAAVGLTISAISTVSAVSGQAAAAPNGVQAPTFEAPRYEPVKYRIRRSGIIGTWKVVETNGGWTVYSFNRNGGFAIVHSTNPKWIIAGKWRKRGQSIRVTLEGICTRKLSCKALPAGQRKVVVITVRRLDGKRMYTSEGTMRRVSV